MAGRDAQRDVRQCRRVRAGLVREVDVAQLDGAVDGLQKGAGAHVDAWDALHDGFEGLGGAVGFCSVGGDGERATCGLSAEDNGRVADEELEHGVFAARHEAATVPEAEGEGAVYRCLGCGEEDGGLGCGYGVGAGLRDQSVAEAGQHRVLQSE